MDLDFNLKVYKRFLNTLSNQDFSFQIFSDFIVKPAGRACILRHDVDKLPGNSLIFAKIQHELGIRGTYFFRVVRESLDEKIIKKLESLGHEIGYHYEDVSTVAERQKGKIKILKGRNLNGSELKDYMPAGQPDNGDFEKELAGIAIESFKKNLQSLREIAPVKTICMHGSPMSRWDNRLLWEYYDYHDFGIVGEPYFDVNFDEVLYLTDTGRRWDGDSVNVRDKEFNRNERKDVAKGAKEESPRHPEHFPRFHSTFDIIHAAEEERLPDKIMMTFHPQRWTDRLVPWTKELVWQNVKNVGKYFILKGREIKKSYPV